VLLKAIERRARSARDGRGVRLADGGFDLLNPDSPSQGFCFDGPRSIGDADTVGIAKFEALLSKSPLASRWLRPRPASAPLMVATDSSSSSCGDGSILLDRCILLYGIASERSWWSSVFSMLAMLSSNSSCGDGSTDVGLEVEADLGLWLPGLDDFKGEKSSVFRGIGPR